MSLNIKELKENLDKAQQDYNAAWASDVDTSRGYMQGKIRRDFRLESSGDALEKARNAYNDALNG